MATDYKALCAELADDLEPWITYGEIEAIEKSHDLIDRARAALAESKPPADGEVATRYEFSVLDADCVEQAGGSAPSLAQALDEGRHYLAVYTQHRPHTLELRRVEVLTSDHLPDATKMVEPTDGEVAELVDSLLSEAGCEDVHGNCATITATELRRAALLLQRLAPQPVPEGPSDEELNDTYWTAWHEHLDRTNSVLHSVGLRAVLARWGTSNLAQVRSS